MVALWMQDWVGLSSYREGERLNWNWQLNENYYPHWQKSVKEWAKDGVKPFIYMNPYFSNLTGSSYLRQDQF